jgi:glycosyltransferase involved in cell wall biosynthesis
MLFEGVEGKKNMSDQPLTLLCLSHLNWNHVWQRPQQLMTRFTQHYRVIYVDPPEISANADTVQLQEISGEQGVRVLHPVFPKQHVESMADYWRLWKELLPVVLDLAGQQVVMWVFSPYADQLVAQAKPQIKLAVYDCMDDLASFKDGSDEMREREAHLLSLANLVFTGGHSMYQARKDRHPHVHCFPSGVDVEHYRRVYDPSTTIPESVASIPHPQLGYFGVLDERINWDLIAQVAERRPDWHWVLVGPTAKVDPAELPVAPNIHYLGQQQYRDLPAFLKSFDVATMPFALNEATRFISPTKTLEYLAGGKWVIGSSVPDVVAFYSEIVAIADGVDAWIAGLEQIFQASPEDLLKRMERARPVLEQSTWDNIAGRMSALIDEQLG